VRRKRFFIYRCVAATVGDSVIGLFKGAAYQVICLRNIFSLPSYMNPASIGWDFYGIVSPLSSTFLLSFVLCDFGPTQAEIDLD